ncbi:MAG: SH3 domain-containing protein [Acetatifactor sp.]|nr:SH3 domain-containing protein [Acetatifactor sp.]
MKIEWKKIMKKISALTLMAGLFLSTTNLFMVYAANSSPATVSTDKPGYGYIKLTSGNLNVRQYATVNSNIVGSLPNHTNIMIVGEEGNFFKVQYSTSGYYGYVSKDYVTFEPQNSYLQVKDISGNLNMRDDVYLTSTILAKLPAKTYFAYINFLGGDYFHGVFANVDGYVAGEYVNWYFFYV